MGKGSLHDNRGLERGLDEIQTSRGQHRTAKKMEKTEEDYVGTEDLLQTLPQVIEGMKIVRRSAKVGAHHVHYILGVHDENHHLSASQLLR